MSHGSSASRARSCRVSRRAPGSPSRLRATGGRDVVDRPGDLNTVSHRMARQLTATALDTTYGVATGTRRRTLGDESVAANRACDDSTNGLVAWSGRAIGAFATDCAS